MTALLGMALWHMPELFEHRRCPDCKGPLILGPRGRLSINVLCDDCGAGFNVCPEMSLVQRINPLTLDDWKRMYGCHYWHEQETM